MKNRAGQEKKELWFNLIATGVVVGLAIVCPPAGLAAGAIYTAIDVGGAIKGEDLISGRKLSDEERLTRGVFAIVPGAGGLAAKSLLKHMPALGTVMKTVSKTMDDAVKPIKSTVHPVILKGKQSIETDITKNKKQVSPVISNLKPGKQSIAPGINTAKNAIEIPTKSKFATKLEQAKELGKAYVEQLKFAVANPIPAAVTSKAGQTVIRESAKFIDNTFRPVHIKSMEVIGGPKIPVGIERGPSKDVYKNKGEDLISRMQAEKEIYLSKSENLKFESIGDYFAHINEIGKRNDMNAEQRLEEIHKAYHALGDAKGDVTVVSSIKFLKEEGFDQVTGRMLIDWPDKMGFVEDSIQPISSKNPLPEQWDRIGGKGGENFTTIPKDGIPYSYGLRAIPYLENPTAQHIGEFNNDLYFKSIDAIKSGNIEELNQTLISNDKKPISKADFKRISSYYNDSIANIKNSFGDIDVTYGLRGTAAPWKSNKTGEVLMEGGADQIVTPLNGIILEKLGIIPKY